MTLTASTLIDGTHRAGDISVGRMDASEAGKTDKQQAVTPPYS